MVSKTKKRRSAGRSGRAQRHILGATASGAHGALLAWRAMTETPLLDTPELAGRRVLLGLTGGIACYKAAELCRLLVRSGAQVRVAMTHAACRFITPLTMQALCGQPVFTSQWDARPHNHMAHIELGREAELILVAPASADFIAQLAGGRADELLALLCLARPDGVPLLLAPAMNRQMWQHPATQRNVHQVSADGASVLGVASGAQACGEVGEGRMLAPEQLLQCVTAALAPKSLAGLRVLISAGPTFEAIDPVRGITNLSSGKMGFAMARAAFEAGAQVQLVAGPEGSDLFVFSDHIKPSGGKLTHMSAAFKPNVSQKSIQGG